MKKPILIYDGDCDFCLRWINYWKTLTQDKVDYAASQNVAEQFPLVPKEQFRQSVQLIDAEGNVFSGAQAVFKTLVYAGRDRLFWLYKNLPGFALASEFAYRLVAKHRVLFARLTKILWGNHLGSSTYILTRWIFLRLLGLVYVIAFLSIFVQLSGLFGSNGIAPIHEYLDLIFRHFSSGSYALAPTIFWLNSSDLVLRLTCGSGVALALLLILDVAPLFCAVGLWGLYLSFVVAGQDFLSFQWDSLLLETGFLAIFLSPARFLPRRSISGSPPIAMVWLMRWLLFRLIFESGCVKLLSRDPSWRNLTALNFHYQTQPLPTWIGYYAHQLPSWFQKFSAVSMFGIELSIPFLIFLPRNPRILAFFAFLLLQTLIGLTGNYCFFNILTMCIALFLLDDQFFMDWLPQLKFPKSIPSPLTKTRKYSFAALAAVVLTVSGAKFLGMFNGNVYQTPLKYAVALAEPFRSINNYGLFAVMTTTRPEIIIEGSNDGKTWMAYEFKWKPGDLTTRPKFAQPHQPRLDWQMWFAALSDYRSNPWLISFMARLLEGKKEVLGLLKDNPFPENPPRYVRAVVYEYRFTDLKTKRETGAWWTRESKGIYCPVLSLKKETERLRSKDER